MMPLKSLIVLVSVAFAVASVPGVFGADPPAEANAPGAKIAPKIIIDQVEVEGVTSLTPEAVEAAVEVGTGEVLDQAKILRTVENLREQYRAIGFEQATIQTHLTRRELSGERPQYVLVIKVEEGSPTRILDITFSLPPEIDLTGPDLGYTTWRRLEKELASRVAIKSGEVLTRERVAGIRRAIQEVFVSDEYIGARVDDLKTVNTTAQPGGLEAGRWVHLEAIVRPGDRVNFGFRGNQVLNQSRLDSIVDEQRSLGLGREYVSAIQSRIQDEYKALGYAKIRITPYTFEVPKKGPDGSRVRHVTYQIEEGPRIRIDSIDFDGNVYFTNEELRHKFATLAPPIVQRGYYVEKDVQHGVELLIEWIKSQGFLSAKLTTVSTTYPGHALPQDKDSTVKLVVYIYEGDQTIVKSVSVNGAHIFDKAAVEKFLGLNEGTPLNLFALSEGIQALKTAYRAQGYLSAAVTNENTDRVVKYSDENRVAEVTLDVSEGPQFHVSRIDVEGRVQTKEGVILRECPLRVGDIIEEPKLAETNANLRRLGIFSSVKVRAVQDPDRPQARVIKISVEEAPPGVIAGGPGFRNDLGIRAFGELGYTNLWGENHSAFLDLAANRRLNSSVGNNAGNGFQFVEYQAQLAYSWPWFMGTDITFRPTLNQSETEFINFDATVTEGALNWEKRLMRSPSLVALFTYSLERVNQFDAINAAQDNGLFRIGSVTPSIRLDMRDNPLAPTRGLYAQASFEWADPIFFSQNTPSPIGYTRFQFRSDYIVPLLPGASWLFSFRAGLERSTVSQSNGSAEVGYGSIPLIKRFALGGIASLRGYAEQELNVNNIVFLTGSASYVNYRTQIDFPIAGSLKFGPFLDAANLQVDTFSFGNLLYGAGFGVRYVTPIGPVSFDYGWKLNPPSALVDSNTAESNFYFSVGVI
jgi:outer membrane protein insertion porin family